MRLNGLPYPAGTRRLHLVSGSVHDGIWGRRIHLPQCGPFGSSSRVHVVAHDRAGHRSGAKGPTIDLTGLDRLAPDVTMSGGIGRAGLYFSEPVHGISTAGVTVSTSTGTT
ncbi:MAG TPA: hypothetical protein VHR35_15940, partial [Nocardioides sp.]|nr:hypothetical protein [Nocardioides sp.]